MQLQALGDSPMGLESKGWAGTGSPGSTSPPAPQACSCLPFLWGSLPLGARALRTRFSPGLWVKNGRMTFELMALMSDHRTPQNPSREGTCLQQLPLTSYSVPAS